MIQRKQLRLMLLMLFAFTGSLFITSCGDDDSDDVTPTPEPELSSEKDITSFSFDGIDPSVTATISGTDITATVPFDTDITALVPTIAISADATVSPASGAAQDFTEPVTYTVTAEDESTQEYTVTVTREDPPMMRVEAIWEKNLASGGVPDWFTANNEREIAHFGEFVYVHTNFDKIRVLDITTGEELNSEEFISGTENFSGGSNVFANLLGMGVDDAGHIVASNGALANGDFRIYRWEDKDASQELLLEGNFESRLGDNISVVGDVYGNATIFAPSQGNSSIYKFTVTDGVANAEPEIITTETALGNGTGVYSISGSATSNFIATGTGLGNVVELNQSGNIVGEIPTGLFTEQDAFVYDALTAIAFEMNGRRYFAAAATNYRTAPSSNGKLFIVDYTNGWEEITENDIISVPFTEADGIDANANATGGISVSVNGNEATIYGLITNFGIGAYTFTYE